MKYQRGLTLTGLMVWGVVIAMVALLGIKVSPEVIEYYKVKKSIEATANNASGKTVPQIRAIYDKYADVDYIKTVTGADLDISKESGQIIVAFSYEKRIPLFYNVSLLIDFQGSASGRE